MMIIIIINNNDNNSENNRYIIIEIKQIWQLKAVIIPAVVGGLGTIKKKTEDHIKRIPGNPFFLVSYVGERPWWPIQCLNKGGKDKGKD